MGVEVGGGAPCLRDAECQTWPCVNAQVDPWQNDTSKLPLCACRAKEHGSDVVLLGDGDITSPVVAEIKLQQQPEPAPEPPQSNLPARQQARFGADVNPESIGLHDSGISGPSGTTGDCVENAP